MTLRHRDRLHVERDGEEVEVFNWVNVKHPAVVRGGNPVVERFDAEIGAGDSTVEPDAVTEWVAAELDREFSIDVSEHGIEIVDVEDDSVSVL